MKELILLGGFAAIAVFGYYIMSRLDGFLNAVQKEAERQEETPYLSIATSSLDAVPEVLHILEEISLRYPEVRCSISIGQEEEVVRPFKQEVRMWRFCRPKQRAAYRLSGSVFRSTRSPCFWIMGW